MRKRILSYGSDYDWVGYQLIAIEALGESRSRRALRYLKRVYRGKDITEEIGGHFYAIDDTDNPRLISSHIYPNAKRELAKAMEYGLLYDRSEYLRFFHRGNKKTDRVHGVFERAIKKLETHLK